MDRIAFLVLLCVPISSAFSPSGLPLAQSRLRIRSVRSLNANPGADADDSSTNITPVDSQVTTPIDTEVTSTDKIASSTNITPVDSQVTTPIGTEESSTRKITSFLKRRFTKKNLAAAGLSVFLSYGFVSNINSCTMLAWVWAKYVKDTGISPFVAPHPPFFTNKFFAYYGAVYITVGTLLRPLRAVIAGAISPIFNNAIETLQTKLKLPKPLAVLSVILACNVVFTFAWLFLNLKVAFLVLQVPPIAAVVP